MAANDVRILLLGPVELWVGERRAGLGGRNQRALLALLALAPGQTVSRDRAAEALWGESVPDSYPQRLHTVVSRLRTALREAGATAEIVETAEVGYRLRIDADRVDTVVATCALQRSRQLRAEGRPDEAASAARAGVELWRGSPLADVLDNGWADNDVRRLEDLRLSLLEEDFEARLTLGASPGLVDDLEAACAEAPLRERLHAQLVLALAAWGRRADALQAYDRVRRRLSEELGIEPGATLLEAHRAVLTQEPVRVAPPSSGRRPRARPGRRLLVGVAIVVAAVAATAGILLATGGRAERRATLRLPAGDLVLADRAVRQIRAELPLSGTVINEQPGGLVVAGGSLWSVTEQGTVTQVELARRRVVGSTPLALPAGPGGMAVGLGAAWVTDSGSPTLYRLGSGISAARRIALPRLAASPRGGAGGVATAEGSLWVVRAAGVVDRLSRNGELERRLRIPGADQVVSDGRAVWVVSPHLGVITRVDPRTNAVRARARVRPPVCCLAVGGGSAWATSEASGLLWQIGPDGAVQNVVHVPAPATEVAYADGAVWVSGYTGGTLTRVDPQTLDVRVVRTDRPVAGLAAARGLVAFSTFASSSAALSGVEGPIARIVMPHDELGAPIRQRLGSSAIVTPAGRAWVRLACRSTSTGAGASRPSRRADPPHAPRTDWSGGSASALGSRSRRRRTSRSMRRPSPRRSNARRPPPWAAPALLRRSPRWSGWTPTGVGRHRISAASPLTGID